MNIKMLFTALIIGVSTIAFVVPATYSKTPRSSSKVQESDKICRLTRENWAAVNVDAFTEFLVALNKNDIDAGRQLFDKNLIVQFPAGTKLTVAHFVRLDTGLLLATVVTRDNVHYLMLIDPDTLSDRRQ
jgi:hypothetical protein